MRVWLLSLARSAAVLPLASTVADEARKWWSWKCISTCCCVPKNDSEEIQIIIHPSHQVQDIEGEYGTGAQGHLLQLRSSTENPSQGFFFESGNIEEIEDPQTSSESFRQQNSGGAGCINSKKEECGPTLQVKLEEK